MLNRTQAPPIHDAIDFKYELQPCNKVICNNDIPLYWLNAGAEEVVMVEWVFPAGLWNEPQTAVAQATAALLKNGTENKNAFQINEAIEFYGASLRVSVNNDYAFVTLYTLTKHLQALIPLVYEIMTSPHFPDEELDTYIRNAVQRLSVNLLQSDFVANRNIDALLFGKAHPYGRYTEVADLQALTTATLRQFHHNYYNAANCTIFMAGHITDKHVGYVQEYFGKDNWNDAAAIHPLTYTLQPAAGRKQRILNDEKSVQGAVRIARDFITRSHPDFAPMIVLNTVLGGYFGSRLMANIREDKGYTYGIYSSLYPTRHAGAMMIATEAGKEVCEQTVLEVYKEMNLLREELISDEELLLVKNYLLGNLLGDLDGPFSIMQRWKNLILNGLPNAHFDKNIQIYKTITAPELQALAQQYYNPDDFYELVVV
jgi:predicted Zn-dependent peptidase